MGPPPPPPCTGNVPPRVPPCPRDPAGASAQSHRMGRAAARKALIGCLRHRPPRQAPPRPSPQPWEQPQGRARRGDLGPSARLPIRPLPTPAGGHTCSSTVLGVTFTVWRRPFGASTDTEEPPPPAGAAIFRSRDLSRLAFKQLYPQQPGRTPTRPRGRGRLASGPRPRLRPRHPGYALVSAPVLLRMVVDLGPGQGHRLFIPRRVVPASSPHWRLPERK